jgi:hypothetical protein
MTELADNPLDGIDLPPEIEVPPGRELAVREIFDLGHRLGREAEQRAAARKTHELDDAPGPVAVVPLFPEPSEPFTAETAVVPFSVDGPYRARGEGADFCHRVRDHGASVDKHGTHCESRTIVNVDAFTAAGENLSLEVDLVQHYRHGVYAGGFHTARPWVRLASPFVFPDPDDAAFHVSIGNARRLIAALQRAVDAADGLDRPVRG